MPGPRGIRAGAFTASGCGPFHRVAAIARPIVGAGCFPCGSVKKIGKFAVAWTPDRRSLFLAAATLALAGCAAAPREAVTDTGGAGAPVMAGGRSGPLTKPEHQRAGSPEAAVSASPTPAQPGTVLTREEVVQTHAGRTASYWGLEAPGVLTGRPPTTAGLALTFDFCGGAGGNAADQALLAAPTDNGLGAALPRVGPHAPHPRLARIEAEKGAARVSVDQVSGWWWVAINLPATERLDISPIVQ